MDHSVDVGNEASQDIVGPRISQILGDAAINASPTDPSVNVWGRGGTLVDTNDDCEGSVWHCVPEITDDSDPTDAAEAQNLGWTQVLLNLQEQDVQPPGVHLAEVPNAADPAQDEDLTQLVRELQDNDALSEQSDDDAACPASLHILRNPLFQTGPWNPDEVRQGDAVGCSICLTEFEAAQQVTMILRCSHRFHLGCLRRWMATPPFSCPMCRTDAAAFHAPAVGEKDSAAVRHGWQPKPLQSLAHRNICGVHPSKPSQGPTGASPTQVNSRPVASIVREGATVVGTGNDMQKLQRRPQPGALLPARRNSLVTGRPPGNAMQIGLRKGMSARAR